MVLVDSSIWIDYFKSDRKSVLTDLLINDMVCTNEVILSELIPHVLHKNEEEIVEGLNSLSIIKLDIDWNGVRMLQFDNLSRGINHIGIPDLIIVQQVIQNKIKLWSKDKHFELMSHYMDFDLYN